MTRLIKAMSTRQYFRLVRARHAQCDPGHSVAVQARYQYSCCQGSHWCGLWSPSASRLLDLVRQFALRDPDSTLAGRCSETQQNLFTGCVVLCREVEELCWHQLAPVLAASHEPGVSIGSVAGSMRPLLFQIEVLGSHSSTNQHSNRASLIIREVSEHSERKPGDLVLP